MANTLPGPNSHVYFSQQLRLHYVDWGNEDKPALLLLHGGRDHCRNWDWVAQALRDDYHIVAPDLRGHGDSQWVLGSGYAMVDYVYDIAQLVNQKHLDPVTIIGHSLGGSVSLQFAGVFPERVDKVIAIEGLGPRRHEIDEMEKPAPERMRRWIDQIHGFAGRLPRRYASLEEAIRRMHEANAHLSDDQARHLTIHGTNQNEDGSHSWKFDNYVRSHSPYRFNSDEAQDLWSNITAPTLLLWGHESWSGDPSKDNRTAPFQNVQVEGIPDAGHWLHHDQLDQFLRVVSSFLSK